MIGCLLRKGERYTLFFVLKKLNIQKEKEKKEKEKKKRFVCALIYKLLDLN